MLREEAGSPPQQGPSRRPQPQAWCGGCLQGECSGGAAQPSRAQQNPPQWQPPVDGTGSDRSHPFLALPYTTRHLALPYARGSNHQPRSRDRQECARIRSGLLPVQAQQPTSYGIRQPPKPHSFPAHLALQHAAPTAGQGSWIIHDQASSVSCSVSILRDMMIAADDGVMSSWAGQPHLQARTGLTRKESVSARRETGVIIGGRHHSTP